MTYLYERLCDKVGEWREAGYPCADYSAIAEVFEWATLEGEAGLRYLRQPQLHALETYWYLRVVEGTPKVAELYRRVFDAEANLPEYLEALGIAEGAFRAANYNLPQLIERIQGDDEFVRRFKMEALRESLTLDYPSYILALAMGAGKTLLIGAIIASEFAMALEYPGGPFVQNALVFAPGKTILESLRELAAVPYEKILPPRLHRQFTTHAKLTFTRDGEKDIPVIRGSSFNLVVTNTEKIRIQRSAIPKSLLGGLLDETLSEAARQEVANLRLQAIASLPHLAIFSDEAHHTYGQALDAELKKVRKTVDYLAANTNVVCVVNTTGTPYYQRQPLRDVVIWYGLAEGIRDGILKDLSGSIQSFYFEGDPVPYLEHVIQDFFKDYGDVRLPNGAPAKLAIYFPQTDDLRQLRPTVDRALAAAGISPALCLVNTSDESLTKQADIDAFNRLNDPAATHRVMLLVNKGTEGWNCPSLFACALARRLKTSNNFVLQAATRCLRQVPGNTRKARVYLSVDNFKILDRQLQETYGQTISELNRQYVEQVRCRIILRKADIPPLVVPRIIRTVVPKQAPPGSLRLAKPTGKPAALGTVAVYTLAEQQATDSVLRQVGQTVQIEAVPRETDAYAAAIDLGARYRLDLWTVYDELRRLYGQDDIPLAHLDPLADQIEKQTRAYEVREERQDVALALVKPEGFTLEEIDGAECYTAEIVYPKDKENLLLSMNALQGANPGGFGFHYDPYNFDSNPEKSFFELVLAELNLKPAEIEDILFTGAITDPGKTEFRVEYKDGTGDYHHYTPDFIIRRKPAKGRPRGSGKVFIVEVKDARFRDHGVEGERGRKAMAVRRWENLDPKRFQYHMVFTAAPAVSGEQLGEVRSFIAEEET